MDHAPDELKILHLREPRSPWQVGGGHPAVHRRVAGYNIGGVDRYQPASCVGELPHSGAAITLPDASTPQPTHHHQPLERNRLPGCERLTEKPIPSSLHCSTVAPSRTWRPWPLLPRDGKSGPPSKDTFSTSTQPGICASRRLLSPCSFGLRHCRQNCYQFDTGPVALEPTMDRSRRPARVS